MSSWTPRRVLEAAAASQWCPDGAIEVLTDDYRLIRYPDWALDPAFPAAQVTWSRSERTAAEVIGEVAERVRQWGKPGVAWWVSSATLPPDTEAALRAAGGKQIDAVQIGEFVECKCKVVRRTRALVFMSGELVVGTRVVATANGVWKTLGKR